MNATEWFDQFPPLAPGSEWNTQGQWCPRHWAPCPILNANGIGASTELMAIYVNEICPADITEPEAMNRHMQSVGYLCCTLGDERMHEVWGHWPPPDEEPAA